MSVGALASDVCLLLGGSAAVSAGDVLFLLRLGLDFNFLLPCAAFCTATEGYASEDDGIDVVSSVASAKTPSNSPVRGRTCPQKRKRNRRDD